MDFSEFQSRLWNLTKEHGKNLWSSIEQEMTSEGDPAWNHIGDNIKDTFSHLGMSLGHEFTIFLQAELRRQGIPWESLLVEESDMDAAYQALGLAPGADQSEIKERWRSLMVEFHPDRFMPDPEKYKWATEKTQQFTAAYNLLTRGY